MADHNFLTDTYDSNTAILDECKAYIAEIVLPSEHASQFEDDGFLARSTIDAINAVLSDVSLTFEGQAYMYRFAKKGVCIIDANYVKMLADSINDIIKATASIKDMVNTISKINNVQDVEYIFPTAFFSSLYIKYNSINLITATDEELEEYYIKLCSLDENELMDDEKEKIEEYMDWLMVKTNMDAMFHLNSYDERYLSKYVTLYEKFNPEKAKNVAAYMEDYPIESRNEDEIRELKYQIYTSEYRYNLIVCYQDGQMSNKVYDSSNYDHYGSRQHSAMYFFAGAYNSDYPDDIEYINSKEEEYKRIVEKNVSKNDYKKIAGTHESLYNYLSKINSHGCAYAAVVNTIFNYYIGKEKEFKDTFGYEMYDKYGDLNYDLLLVDIYTSRKKP